MDAWLLLWLGPPCRGGFVMMRSGLEGHASRDPGGHAAGGLQVRLPTRWKHGQSCLTVILVPGPCLPVAELVCSEP